MSNAVTSTNEATTPDARETLTFTFEGVEYKAYKKFKRLKFLRYLDENSPWSAFALAVVPADMDKLEDQDLEEDAMSDLLEILAKTLMGSKSKDDAKGNS